MADVQRAGVLTLLVGACFVIHSLAGRDLVPGMTYTVPLTKQDWPLHTLNGKVQRKSVYYGKVSMGGNGAQLMDVVFDTGSGHLVVPSVMCHSETCLRKRRYRRKASPTGLDINVDYPQNPVIPGQPRDQLAIEYGSGSVKGVLVRDYTCLGPHDAPDLKSVSLLQTLAGWIGDPVEIKKTHVVEEEDDTDSTRKHMESSHLDISPGNADSHIGTAPASDMVTSSENGDAELQTSNQIASDARAAPGSIGSSPELGGVAVPQEDFTSEVERGGFSKWDAGSERVERRRSLIERYVHRVGAAGCADFQYIVATEISNNPFASYEFDGILGLGLVGLAKTPEFNFMHVFSESGAWTGMPGMKKAFSVFLGWDPSEISDVTFGGWDASRVVAGDAITWHDVLDADLGYWQIHVDEIYADGEKLDFCDDGTCRAIVDTGTSLLAVPKLLGRRLIRQLRHQDEGNLFCNGKLPELKFVLDDRIIILGPDDYARPEVAGDPTYVGKKHNDTKSHTVDDPTGAGNQVKMLQLASDTPQMCLPMIMFVDLEAPLSDKTLIFGSPMIEKYYTTLDTNPEHPRIGFAEAHHEVPRKPLDFLGILRN